MEAQVKVDEDAVIRVAACHHPYAATTGFRLQLPPTNILPIRDPRVLQHNGLIDFDSLTLARIPRAIASSSRRAPLNSMGPLLGKLPNELLINIITRLDVESYLRFRHVSTGTRYLASNLFEYRSITQSAPGCLLVVTRTQLNTWFTFTDLYRTFCRTDCENCGVIGHFLYLPTAMRICLPCSRSMAFRTVSLASFARAAPCSQTKVRKATPVMKTSFGRRLYLVNYDAAVKALPAMQHRHLADRWFDHRDCCLTDRPRTKIRLPFYDKSAGRVCGPLRCRGCVNLHKTGATAGLACAVLTQRQDNADVEYLRDTFMAHFRECALARKIWEDYQVSKPGNE